MDVNDGDVKISITADNSGLQTALQQTLASLEGLKASISGLNTTMAANASATNAAAATFARASREAAGLSDAVKGSHMNVATLTRELLVMGREIAQGRFTRLAGSATILTSALGVTAAALLGTLAAAAALAGPIALISIEMNKGEQAAIDYANALAATGKYAALTDGEFAEAAKRIHQATGASTDDVRKLGMQVIDTGKVTGDNVGLMTEAAIRLAKALGEKPEEAMRRLIALTGDTTGAALKLNDQLHNLHDGVLQKIKDDEKAGNSAGALNVELLSILGPLRAQEGELTKTGGILKTVADLWDNLTSSMQRNGRVKQDIASGRGESNEDKIADAKYTIAGDTAERNLAALHHNQGLVDLDNQRIAAAQKLLALATAAKGIEDSHLAANTAQTDAQDAVNRAVANELPQDKERREITNDIAKITTAIGNGTLANNAANQQALQIDQARLAALKDHFGRKTPKGPQVNVMEGYKAQLDAELNADMESKAKQIADEVKFWADKLALIKGNGAKEVNLRNEIAGLERSALQKQHDFEAEQDKKAANVQEKVDQLKATGAAKVAEMQAQATRDGELETLDAQIEGMRSRMSTEKGFSAQSIAQLTALYQQRAAIMSAGARAEAEAAASAAESDYNEAGSKEGGPDLQAQQRALNAMTEAWAKYALQVAAINKTLNAQVTADTDLAAKKVQEAFQKTATGIADTMRTTFEGLIEKTTSWQKIWLDVQRKMLDGFLRMGEQMILQNLAKNTTIVAQDKAAAAAGGQADLARAMVTISNNAAQAASGAFKAMTQLGPIGVALAPAAAATAFGAVMAFEGGLAAFSAAGGMDIPKGMNPIVQTHAEEMILPAHIANPMREMLKGGTGGSGVTNSNRMFTNSGGIHFHQAPGQDPADFAQKVQAALFQGKRRNMYDPRMMGLA